MAEIQRPHQPQSSLEIEGQEHIDNPELGVISPEATKVEVEPGPQEQNLLARIEQARAGGASDREVLEAIAQTEIDTSAHDEPAANTEESEVVHEGEYIPPDANEFNSGQDSETEGVNAYGEASPEDSQLHQEILKNFPELGEVEGREAVLEALATILESNKITLEELKFLAPNGFEFRPEEEVPEQYQPKDPNAPREKYITGVDWKNGKILVYKEFLEALYTTSDRAHFLAHEMGELAMRQKIEKEGENGEIVEDLWVNVGRYHDVVENRPIEWNSPYVRAQVEEQHYLFEMLADDMSDFLRSDSSQSFLANRLARFPDAQRAAIEEGLANGDSQLIPLLSETMQVYAFLTAEFSQRKQHQGSEKKQVDDQEFETLLPVQGTEIMHSSNPDTKSFSRAIGWLFFAGQPPN